MPTKPLKINSLLRITPFSPEAAILDQSMATAGRLWPFHAHTKLTPSLPMLMTPTFIWWRGKSSLSRRARFFCSKPKIGMSRYKEKFAQRMAMAGLKPHHRIAMAVSGGPDSMALCVLTADWKSDNFNAGTNGRSNSIDGLLAIIVDHGLRTESAVEANLVYNRIIDMGIKCEVACCDWLDGRPKLGHLQEAARNKRYETLQNICIQQKIGILLIAHHADDQAELFILRLSRNSGVLGLAGTAFTSQLFPEFPDFSEGSKDHGILLVRPLLEFSKQDMYNICQGGNQKWVEDPTNKSPLYARNRIRMSLNNLSSPIFKAELQAAVSACRRTRLHVDKYCRRLLNQAVTIMPHGYAVIDLGILHSKEVKDTYLSKFVALALQFISQRHKPVRGSGSKLLLSYFRTFPCKTSLTVAGCYLCPAPGSKGTKVLVCCSVDSSLLQMMKMFHGFSYSGQNCFATSELKQIVMDGESYLDKFTPDISSVPFLDVTSSESVLTEAKRIGILSDSTYRSIVDMQKEESKIFKSKPENISDFMSKYEVRSSAATMSKLIYPGQVGYFMNRFVLNWKVCDEVSCNALCMNESVSVKELAAKGQHFCSSCLIADKMMAEVRHMIDADWIYLSELSKKANVGDCRPQKPPAGELEQKTSSTKDYAIFSACRALVTLKCIPVAARRAIPVLVDTEGVLLSIPSICFSHCPRLLVSAVFNPRIPLGGGHSSFL